MGLRIRPATRADAEAIAGLHLASYRAAYKGLLSAQLLSSLRTEDRQRRWQLSLNDPQRQTLIAQSDDDAGTVIGFAEVGPSRDDDAGAGTGELMALHVAPSRWRQGAGRALHDAAVATLATRGFLTVTLWVLTGNGRARAFYEAMGWNHDGTVRQHLAWGVEPVAEARYCTGCQGGERKCSTPIPGTRLGSGDGPLSVRARPSSIKRHCPRRTTSGGQAAWSTYTRSGA
jgi:GNAT superfamily N-acetyltransferase